MNLSNEVAADLASALRETSEEASALRRVFRASLPQWWNDKKLRERYGDIDGKQLRALLETHRIQSIPRGRGLVVHIENVLRLDELMKRRQVTP